MDWLLEHGTRVTAIAVVALAVIWAVRRWIPRAVRVSVARGQAEAELAEQEKRVQTLAYALVISAEIGIAVIALFLALGELGFELAPLIAGAGIAGIAIGFGAQSLVRDVLAGLFILFENQYGIGDVVRVAGIGGKVEALNLRRTVLPGG